MITLLSWKAHPYQNQITGIISPGKIHLLNDAQDTTLCGKDINDFPGELIQVPPGSHNCKVCLRAVESKARHEEWQRKFKEQEAQRQRDNEVWWRNYTIYLSSPEWKAKRTLVMRRANHVCEGCGRANAVEIHHLTYQRVGHEMLFDLQAVCRPCHQALHPEKDLSGDD
jgi:HNH endonuclease